MSSSIFLSYPRPFKKRQEEFIERIIHYFEERELQPRTLGVTDYDMDAPLTAIRRLMLESNGLVTIAFRRSLIKQGTGKPNSDIGEAVSTYVQENCLDCNVKIMAIEDCFVEQGLVDELREKIGISSKKIYEKVKELV